jgi:AcrR family transcriptional regulator
MRQAAASAHMSLGGIYHYFPSKRELVLFGVSPEMFARSCADFHAQYGYLAQTDPDALLAVGLDAAVAMVSFARPALVASIELGAATALHAIEEAMSVTLDDFVRMLRAIRPKVTDAELDALQRAVRRVLLAAMLDRKASPIEVHGELRALVEQQAPASPRQ